MSRKVLVYSVLAALVLVLVGGAWYAGLFHSIQVKEEEYGPFLLVYQEHKGDYRQTATLAQDLANRLKTKGFSCQVRFGLFLDDPERVLTDSLRSWSGWVIDESDFAKIPELDTSFKVTTLPIKRYAGADFPFRGPLTVLCGISRVYPRINRYMESHSLTPAPTMEIYDAQNSKITYLVEVLGTTLP